MNPAESFEIAEQTVVRLKNRAFTANARAKTSTGPVRSDFYRQKDRAINACLEAGLASVLTVDWSRPDAVIGIEFACGGKLHIKLSCLTLGAMKAFRRELNGELQPVKRRVLGDYEYTDLPSAA